MTRLLIPIKNNSDLVNRDFIDLNKLFVEPKFGRTPYYLIVDQIDQELKLIQNTNHHFGGTDTPVSIVAKNAVDTILAAQMGYGPYIGLRNNNVHIYQVESNLSVNLLINKFNSGELKTMQLPPEGMCCSGKRHN